MIRRALTWGGVLLLVFSSGCAYRNPVSADRLQSSYKIDGVPPTPAQALNGTYADHSPSVFGGSVWEMLTGEALDSPGIVQTRIRALPGMKLAVTRLVNGVESGCRVVPYWIKNGYVRISHLRWWTLLLVSDVVWDESALAREDNKLVIFQEKGYMPFLTFLPVPLDTPFPDWYIYPAADSTAVSSPATRPQSRESTRENQAAENQAGRENQAGKIKRDGFDFSTSMAGWAAA